MEKGKSYRLDLDLSSDTIDYTIAEPLQAGNTTPEGNYFQFKMVVGDALWIGYNEVTLDASINVAASAANGNFSIDMDVVNTRRFILEATWDGENNYEEGWTLKITPVTTSENAEITKVEFMSSFNNWAHETEMIKDEDNVWTLDVDVSNYTDDIEFKLLVNESYWIGNGSSMVIDAPEGWVEGWVTGQGNGFWNYVFKNSTTGYNAYQITAFWAPNVSATDGWTLSIRGIEAPSTAPEPYAVLSEDTTVLTFYYDVQKEVRGGMSVGPFGSYKDVSWYNQRDNIASVVFDTSFAACTTLTSTAYWFYMCFQLTTIQGIENLNTVNVTNMSEMFSFCEGLTNLDLSNFSTTNVTDMAEMFQYSSGLATIYVGSEWSTAKVETEYGRNMFLGCTALVGINGTAYDADHVDADYAHVDGGTANPGYLSLLLTAGDANGDGEVNIADAVATVTNILGEETEAPFYKNAADMNADSEIDIFDVTLIVREVLYGDNTAGARSDVPRGVRQPRRR